MTWTEEANIAVAAARQAVQLCQAVWEDMQKDNISMQKDDCSPVTVADYGAQALICHHLSQQFPNILIVAEESPDALLEPEHAELHDKVVSYVQRLVPDATPKQIMEWLGRGGHELSASYWVIDPIDGTKGFLRQEQYAVALALIEEGNVKLGLLACPRLSRNNDNNVNGEGCIFLAQRGQGAFMASLFEDDWEPIKVSNATTEPKVWTEGVTASSTNHAGHAEIAKQLGYPSTSLRVDSQVKYALVARGQAQLYLRIPGSKNRDYQEKIWDHAPGAIIIEEAGGKVTGQHGQPLDYQSSHTFPPGMGIVASEGSHHDQVIAAVKQMDS